MDKHIIIRLYSSDGNAIKVSLQSHFNPINAGTDFVRFFLKLISPLITTSSTCESNQQDLKIVDLPFVKSE